MKDYKIKSLKKNDNPNINRLKKLLDMDLIKKQYNAETSKIIIYTVHYNNSLIMLMLFIVKS